MRERKINMKFIRKTLLIWIMLAVALAAFQQSSLAENISDLIAKAKDADKKRVEVSGEVIGDVMIRGEWGWVNIADKTGAIGVWARTEDLKKIAFTGDYKNRGDMIQVKGVFSRACDQHGGDTDIHADELLVINKGEETPRPVDLRKIIWLLSLILLALTSLLIKYWADNRRERH